MLAFNPISIREYKFIIKSLDGVLTGDTNSISSAAHYAKNPDYIVTEKATGITFCGSIVSEDKLVEIINAVERIQEKEKSTLNVAKDNMLVQPLCDGLKLPGCTYPECKCVRSPML